MFRHFAIMTAAALVAAATLSAGQVQIGGTNGLTGGYIVESPSCAIAANGPNWLGCPTTSGQTLNSGTNPSEKNYNNNLFSGVSSGTPYVGYPNGPGTMGNSDVTFNMVSDSAQVGKNYWAELNATQLTIPIGIFGVSDVWTMLNDNWGCTSGQTSGPCLGASNADTVIKFTFDAASNGSDAASLEQVTLTLVNGNEIRDAVDCTSGGNCSTLGYATSLVATNNMTPTLVTGSIGVSNITVNTANLYTAEYANASSGAGNYANTSGLVVLDAQQFNFGTLFANDYLVKISVSDPNAASGTSRTALSAITVDTVPEPSTLMLLGAGLGILGFKKFRRA